VVEGGVEGSAG